MKSAEDILKEYIKLAGTLGRFPTAHEVQRLIVSERQVKNHFGGFNNLKEAAMKEAPDLNKVEKSEVKVLIFDIETAPIIAHVWDIWNQNVGLNQIVSDWHVLSWAAKWLDAPENEVMYMDQRNAKNIEDDKEVLKGIWDLLNEADVVITQNGKRFDVPRLNSRFIIHGMKPPSSFKHIDTLALAKKHFGFTSNKLEHMTNLLCTKYKKLTNRKFNGHSLWTNCLNGNLEAWKEMEKYNKYDVLSLEELYKKLIPWDSSVNFNLYHNEQENVCKCGSKDFIKEKKFAYTPSGRFQKYRCKKCGAETRGSENLFSKAKKDALKKGVVR